MKGTRLWIETGSPLIHGASRSRGPLGVEWLRASLVAVLAVIATLGFLAVNSAPAGQALMLSGVGDFVMRALPAAAAAATTSLIAVWFARRMGWRREWVTGAGSGILVGLLVHLVVIAYTMQTTGK